MTWRDRAICASDPDPDAWFGTPTDPRWAYAVAVCTTCPVQENCAEFAIETDQRHGIWSGTDLTEPLPRTASRRGSVGGHS